MVGLTIPKDCEVTPKLLRELADMLECRQAYGDIEFVIDDESYKPEFLGEDRFGRECRRWIDKSMTLKFKLLGPVEVQTRYGDWVVYE